MNGKNYYNVTVSYRNYDEGHVFFQETRESLSEIVEGLVHLQTTGWVKPDEWGDCLGGGDFLMRHAIVCTCLNFDEGEYQGSWPCGEELKEELIKQGCEHIAAAIEEYI